MGRRRTRTVALTLALAMLVGAGCGGDDGGDGSARDAQRWEGRFDSTFGELTFTADGDQVTGSYELCDGTLEGTASGADLSGEWTEDPDSCPPQELRGEEAFTGTFDFTLDADGKSFRGTWAFEDGSTDPTGDTWEGTRISTG